MLQAALLKNSAARVTLFPVGQALLNNESKDPGVWKWFHVRGHEFGYHGWDHTDPWVLSESELLVDYDRWQDALFQVLGSQPQVRFASPRTATSAAHSQHAERQGGDYVVHWLAAAVESLPQSMRWVTSP
jgi:peptidoglycan/xylan/chitin deacetylase (PgdA/CDA1 family)